MSKLWGVTILGLEIFETPQRMMNFISNFGIGVEIQQGVIVSLIALEYFFSWWEYLFGVKPSNFLIIGVFIYVIISSLSAIALIRSVKNQPKLFSEISCPICRKGVYIPTKYKCNRCGSDISPNQKQSRFLDLR